MTHLSGPAVTALAASACTLIAGAAGVRGRVRAARGIAGPGPAARGRPWPSADVPDVLLVGFVGGTGGASTVMRELAAGLRGRGVDARLVVPDWETTVAFARSCADLGVPVERTPWLNLETGGTQQFFEALRFLRRYRAPVLHYHVTENYVDPAFLRAMDVLRPPRAFATMHSPYDTPGADAPEVRRWALEASRHFRGVIGVSRESRERQVRNGVPAALTSVIYNAVDVERFARGNAAAVRDALPGVPPTARLIVSTARVEHQKQPLAAVAAFARLADELPDAHLVFVGRGPLEDATRAAADEAGLGARVHLVGHQTNIPDWLAASSAWLLPTIGEAFSIGLIEALAAGCAVVSTRCPGNNEVLVDGQNALTVPVGDVDAMAASLRRALTDRALRTRLGLAARATAERHSLDVAVDQHLACYGDALATPHSRRDVA